MYHITTRGSGGIKKIDALRLILDNSGGTSCQF